MRITIDITEAEERSATIRPETGSVLVTGSAGAEEAPPKDGGPPPEAAEH